MNLIASSKVFHFDRPLLEGIIKSRPNRFIMIVDCNGMEYEAHCPVTGKIWNIDFKDSYIPCLLSEPISTESLSSSSSSSSSSSPIKKRRTNYTVEAISLQKPVDPSKKWIGINQSKVNRYIEYFLTNSYLKFAGPDDIIKREVKLGDSRIDFQIGMNSYLEVKTPLMLNPRIPIPDHVKFLKTPKSGEKVTSLDRLIKHYGELTTLLKPLDSGIQSKAYLCQVYMYDAPRFKPPENPSVEIVKAVESGYDAGVESWQINLEMDSHGIRLLDYFQLHLFSRSSHSQSSDEVITVNKGKNSILIDEKK